MNYNEFKFNLHNITNDGIILNILKNKFNNNSNNEDMELFYDFLFFNKFHINDVVV